MKCAEITDDLLLDYADWRLTPAERDSIGRHLDSCDACQTRRDEVELMSGALKTAVEPPPRALLEGLRAPAPARPAELVQETPSFGHWLYALAGAAAAIILGFLAFMVLPISDQHAGRPDSRETRAAPWPAPEPEQKHLPVNPPPPVVLVPPPKPALVPPVPDPVPPAPPTKTEVVVKKQAPETEVQAAPRAHVPLRGDLNGDGRIDIADARVLQQRLIRGDATAASGDINGDGIVDIADVRHIVRFEISGR